METPKPLSLKLKEVFWPIESHEIKKFLPMAAMMFFMLFNFSSLRSLKDGFVVTSIGPEALSFLKTYIVLPSAILATIGYVKLCNVFSSQKVFYIVVGLFMAYLALFGFVLYPNPETFHPDPAEIARLADLYPNFKWFIRILGKWSYATFYTVAELFGAMVINVSFWQFANQITKTTEAKRFYPMFGLIGNLGLLMTAGVLSFFLSEKMMQALSPQYRYTPIFMALIVSLFFVLVLYRWVNHLMAQEEAREAASGNQTGGKKKSKLKLSIAESFKMIFTSKYLGMIAILVLANGISINLVEGVWKAKVKLLYPSREAYTTFMAQFQAWQGIIAILFMLIGNNILRKTSWKFGCFLTPMIIGVTGSLFFGMIFFEKILSPYLQVVFTGLTPLAIAVFVGMAQNLLSKGSKYSLFDATKEMAYIPLDEEAKTKGKAAVDVIGGRLGKSGGGVIQSTFFMLFPQFGFQEATPFFGIVFFAIVIAWFYGVQALSVEYERKVKNS